MVKAVRETEAALGKVSYDVDATNRRVGRSLYAVKDIKEGEKFTTENVRSIRSANGLHPRFYDDVLCGAANQDIAVGSPLRLDMLG